MGADGAENENALVVVEGESVMDINAGFEHAVRPLDSLGVQRRMARIGQQGVKLVVEMLSDGRLQIAEGVFRTLRLSGISRFALDLVA